MKTLYIGQPTKNLEKCAENNEVSVVFCNNVLEALNILKHQHDIEVILSEYNLSGNNGIYFYSKLKEGKNETVLPFILLVEEHNPNIYKEAFESGIDDYFVINVTDPKQLLKRAKQLAGLYKDSISENPQAEPVKYKFPLFETDG